MAYIIVGQRAFPESQLCLRDYGRRQREENMVLSLKLRYLAIIQLESTLVSSFQNTNLAKSAASQHPPSPLKGKNRISAGGGRGEYI